MLSLRALAVFLIGIALTLPVSAAVYKYIDKNGNLVLTDEPVPGAVLVPEHPVMTMPFPKGNVAAPVAASAKPVVYEITIASPAAQATFARNRDDQVPIAVSVSPELQAGLSLQLMLDDQMFGGDAVPLDQLTRGAHSLSARIVDGNGKVVQDGPSVVFYVQQISANTAHSGH